jgi:hypothetical protein
MSEETKFKSTALWEYTEQITLQPTESTTITVPSTIKTAAKALYFTQRLLKNGASEYQYNVKSCISCKIIYKSSKLKKETFMVLFNRDVEEENGLFTNTSILNLQGNDVDSITINITNHHTTEPLTINHLAFYESDDIQITTIAKVLHEETIAADLIHVTTIMADGVYAQDLETNVKSRDARLAKPGDIVDYIRIVGNEQTFHSDVLGSETEQFKRNIEIAGTLYEYSYWYTAIEGENAYKHLTTFSPRERFPEMADSEVEKFKYLVLKPESSSEKLAFKFAEDENGNLTPSVIYGAGTDNLGLGNGQGFTYKNSNGFYHIYQKSNGDICGIVMDEDGVHIYGWADQHCESIMFRDNGVEIKWTGEETEYFEYVFDDADNMTGIIQNSLYMTLLGYKSGAVGTK